MTGDAMTFQEQMASDMAKLMDTDVFGSSATYVAPGGERTSLTVVLGEELAETKDKDGIKTKLRSRHCTWNAATLATVNMRGHVEIGGDKWAIAELLFDDGYQISVRLERHELYQHTRPDFRR